MKGTWRRALLLLALAGGGAVAQEDSGIRDVLVQCVDGSEVRGTSDLRSFRLETSLGNLTLETAKTQKVILKDGKATVRMTDGSIYSGTADLSSLKVRSAVGEIEIGADKIRSITFGAAKPADAPAANPDRYLKPAATLDVMRSSGRRAFLTSDGGSIVYLNSQDGKVATLDVARWEHTSVIALPAGGSILARSPSGQRAFVASGEKITVCDLKESKVVETFAIEWAPVDLYALDDNNLIASAESTNSALVSVGKRSVVRKFQYAKGCLNLRPDGRRLYDQAGTWFLPSPGERFDPAAFTWTFSSRESGMGRDATMSPDSRYALARHGGLFRIGRSYLLNALPAGTLEPSQSAVFLPKRGKVLTFSQGGEIKTWNLATLKQVGSRRIGFLAYLAFADEAAGMVYLFAGTVRMDGTIAKTTPAGSWYKFEIPE